MEWRYLPLKIYVHYQDGKGRVVSPYIRLVTNTTYAPAQTFAAAWADACAGASGAQILGFDIVAEATTLFAGLPAATSDAYRQGVLLFGTTVPGDRCLLEIPSMRADLLLATGEYAGVKIDQTKPEIQALVSMLLNGNGTVTPTGLTGNDLDHLIEAYVRRL
jgi:hypothetical protein